MLDKHQTHLSRDRKVVYRVTRTCSNCPPGQHWHHASSNFEKKLFETSYAWKTQQKLIEGKGPMLSRRVLSRHVGIGIKRKGERAGAESSAFSLPSAL